MYLIRDIVASPIYDNYYSNTFLKISTFLDLYVTSHARYGAAVTIKCPDNSGEKELTKKLPKTMTVQKLKGLLQRLYKVDSSEQKLSYLDNRVSSGQSLCYATQACLVSLQS